MIPGTVRPVRSEPSSSSGVRTPPTRRPLPERFRPDAPRPVLPPSKRATVDDDDRARYSEWPPSSTARDDERRTKRERYLRDASFPFCEQVDKFEKLVKIGQGTFGEVFKAREKKDPKNIVAVKKVLMENEREGVIPNQCIKRNQYFKTSHANIVHLLEICHTQDSENFHRSTFYLVFEFCEHDLAGLLSNSRVTLSLGEIKHVVKQMLNGLFFIHLNKILHRDMKTANILITKTGTLKLADFGLARAFSTSKHNYPNKLTNCVVTLWYRPPELLLGERNYGPSIDLWGAGCIMAELWTRRPIMPGSTEQSQLMMISQLCGSITPEVWPKVVTLDLYNKLRLCKGNKRVVKERLSPFIGDMMACDLLDKLLTLDPEKRLDADTALDHDFFWNDPMPCDLSKVMSQLCSSNYELHNMLRRANFQTSMAAK